MSRRSAITWLNAVGLEERSKYRPHIAIGPVAFEHVEANQGFDTVILGETHRTLVVDTNENEMCGKA